MARGEVWDKGQAETLKRETESNKSEETPDLGTVERGSSKSSDRAESCESVYHSAYTSAAHGNDDGDGDDDDPDISKLNQAIHVAPVIFGEQQINRPGQRDAPPIILPAQELERLWAKQDSALNVLRAEKQDLQGELDSLGVRHAAILEELSDVKRVKNRLQPTIGKLQQELEECRLGNKQLKEQNESLRQRVHEFAAEIGEGKRQLGELSRTNDRLLRELKLATDEKGAREKTIEAWQAGAEKFVGVELRNEVLGAEVDRVKDDLMKAREQVRELVSQQRDMATEIHQTPAAESQSEEPLSSLEDEIPEAYNINARNQEEEEVHTPDDGAYSTKTGQASEPAAKVDKRHAGTQTTNLPRAESREEPEESKYSSTSVQMGDALESESGTKAPQPEYYQHNGQTLETHVPQSDLALEKFLAHPMPTTFVDATGSVELSGRKINSMYVWPPTPRTDSTVLDSEPSPLSLNGPRNSFHSKARPGRALLSSILEVEGSNLDRLRTDSPPPPFPENSPEPTKARAVAPLGSLMKATSATMPDATLLDSDIPPSMQAMRVFDLSRRRRQPSLQGWSELGPGQLVRLGISGSSMLDSHVTHTLDQASATAFQLGTETHGTELPGPTADKSAQTRTADANAAGTSAESVKVAIQYSPVVWWVLLVCLALSQWLSQVDQQHWVKANEITRHRVLAWRDERWVSPSWLARMSFDAENSLEIDRSMFA